MHNDPVFAELNKILAGDEQVSATTKQKIFDLFESVDPDRWEIIGRMYAGPMRLVAIAQRDIDTGELSEGFETRLYWDGKLHHAIGLEQLKLMYNFATRHVRGKGYETSLEEAIADFAKDVTLYQRYVKLIAKGEAPERDWNVFQLIQKCYPEIETAKDFDLEKIDLADALRDRHFDAIANGIGDLGLYFEKEDVLWSNVLSMIVDILDTPDKCTVPSYQDFLNYVDGRTETLEY